MPLLQPRYPPLPDGLGRLAFAQRSVRLDEDPDDENGPSMPNRFAQANLRPHARPRLAPAVIGADLDAYLDAAETKFSDIRPGARKQIVWADPRT